MIGVIIICIYQEYIRGRLEAPLEAGIDVDVIYLVVILNQGGKEHIVGQCEVYAWAKEQ